MENMSVLVITITRNSQRFVAKMDEIPDQAIIRMEGVHWTEKHRP